MAKGQKTTLTKANIKSGSLRTTVPMSIRQQFELKEGDELFWKLDIKNNNFIIVVEPKKKKER